MGLVDDADFAEQWVQSRRVNAGKGKRALAAELRTKGVDDDVIAAALSGIDASDRARAGRAAGARQGCGGRTSMDDDAEGGAPAGRDAGPARLQRNDGFDVVKAELAQRAGAPPGLGTTSQTYAPAVPTSASGAALLLDGFGCQRCRRAAGRAAGPPATPRSQDSAKLTLIISTRDDDQRGNVVAVRRADDWALADHLEERDLVADRGVLEHHHQLRDQHRAAST